MHADDARRELIHRRIDSAFTRGRARSESAKNRDSRVHGRSSAARYGISLDASLITGIDPPAEVESALAAINTAHNQVSSDISLAQAAAVASRVPAFALDYPRDYARLPEVHAALFAAAKGPAART